MTKAQLSEALKMAQDNSIRFIDDDGKHIVDMSIFDGFALNDYPVTVCTIPQLAALIRWQCIMMNGNVDGTMLNKIERFGRHKFNVV